MRKTPRELGLWLGNLAVGRNNDITDVPNVLVGHVSILRGSGKLIPGIGPVRTGITAILPHKGNIYRYPLSAGVYVFNGFGKSIGVPYIQETGVLNSPVLLTNTLSVNDAACGLLSFLLNQNPEIGNDARTPNLVVFECDDSYLNDIRGRHVKPSDAIIALQRATTGPIPQGSVGAGVGMSCFQLKGGIGSSSRVVSFGNRSFMLGMLALSNYGLLEDLVIEGKPVGLLLKEEVSGYIPGSLILVGITNAPLTPDQLTKLAKRAFLGVARTGALSRTGSGDFCLVISTAPSNGPRDISDWELDNFYQAIIEATLESILNSLFLGITMEGRDGNRRIALPIGKTIEIINNIKR